MKSLEQPIIYRQSRFGHPKASRWSMIGHGSLVPLDTDKVELSWFKLKIDRTVKISCRFLSLDLAYYKRRGNISLINEKFD